MSNTPQKKLTAGYGSAVPTVDYVELRQSMAQHKYLLERIIQRLFTPRQPLSIKPSHPTGVEV